MLLVEGDRGLAHYVRRALEEEHYTVTTCFDGSAGLKAAQEASFDMIVLDVMLPTIDGVELTRRVRLDGVWTPILFLTGRDSSEDIVRGLDAGADDYLTRPFALTCCWRGFGGMSLGTDPAAFFYRCWQRPGRAGGNVQIELVTIARRRLGWRIVEVRISRHGSGSTAGPLPRSPGGPPARVVDNQHEARVGYQIHNDRRPDRRSPGHAGTDGAQDPRHHGPAARLLASPAASSR